MISIHTKFSYGHLFQYWITPPLNGQKHWIFYSAVTLYSANHTYIGLGNMRSIPHISVFWSWSVTHSSRWYAQFREKTWTNLQICKYVYWGQIIVAYLTVGLIPIYVANTAEYHIIGSSSTLKAFLCGGYSIISCYLELNTLVL